MAFVQAARAQGERILPEIYRLRVQEMVDGPRADLVALAEVLDANGNVDHVLFPMS